MRAEQQPIRLRSKRSRRYQVRGVRSFGLPARSCSGAIVQVRAPNNAPARSPARRFTRSQGYKVSQVIRKRVEEIFGWGKSVAGLRRTKLKGRRKTWDGGYLIMAAYNLTRMIRLLRTATT